MRLLYIILTVDNDHHEIWYNGKWEIYDRFLH